MTPNYNRQILLFYKKIEIMSFKYSYILSIILALFLTFGCKKKTYVIVPIEETEVTRKDQTLIDQYIAHAAYLGMYSIDEKRAYFNDYFIEVQGAGKIFHVPIIDFKYEVFDEDSQREIYLYVSNVHVGNVDGVTYLYDKSSTIIGRFYSTQPYLRTLVVSLKNYSSDGIVYNKVDTLYFYH